MEPRASLPRRQRFRFVGTGTGNLSTQHICSRETASDLVLEIIKLVGSKPVGPVVLIGCEHIELVIQLAQHGFVDVTCYRVPAGPHAVETSADIVIAPAADRDPEFPAVLSHLARGLRPGGVLFLGTLPLTRKRQVQALLIQQGFAFTRMRLGRADIDLWCCRKIPVWQAHAA
jgi:hypothetical protein